MSEALSCTDFVDFVRDARLGVLATVSASGEAQAALVDLAVTDAGDLLLNSWDEGRKVANIEAHPKVALVIGWKGGVSLQVEGTAELLTGDRREAYGPTYLDQLAGARILSDRFVLIRVRPAWLRRYDATTRPPTVVEGACDWY